jgi:multidrug efflux pump subunit AcrA (membrane-fusion protein)
MNLPVPAPTHRGQLSIDTTQLVPAAADEFLPPPGGWSRSLGTWVVVGIGVIALGSTVWPLEESIRAPGVVRPAGENSVVQSQQAGRVQSVLVRPNQLVEANQVIAQLEANTLQTSRNQLRHELEQVQHQRSQLNQQLQEIAVQISSNAAFSNSLIASSKAEVDKAAANLGFASSELNRYGSLEQSGAVEKTLLEEKAARHAVSVSELQQARQGVMEKRAQQQAEDAKLLQAASGLRSSAAELTRQEEGLRARLEEVERSLTQTTIRAPIPGSVVAITLNHAGQVVTAGEVVARLAPVDSPLVAKVLVPARDIGPIRTGQRALLRVSGCPYSDYGVMSGEIVGVSADTISAETAAGRAGGDQGPFYEVSVRPQARSLRNTRTVCKLRYGMDLQADLITSHTTVMGSLIRKLRIGTQI